LHGLRTERPGCPARATSGGLRFICNGMTSRFNQHPGAADRARQAPRIAIGAPTRYAMASHGRAIAV